MIILCYRNCTLSCTSIVSGMTSSTHATILKSRSIRSCRFASDKDWKFAITMIFDMQFCLRVFFVFIDLIYISTLPIRKHRYETWKALWSSSTSTNVKIRFVFFYHRIRWITVQFAFLFRQLITMQNLNIFYRRYETLYDLISLRFELRIKSYNNFYPISVKYCTCTRTYSFVQLS